MSASLQRPKSIPEIVTEASSFDHKTQYPLRIALRTAQTIRNQAAQCERSGNDQDAYLFLYRHAEFCMSQIATHPDRKLPDFKSDVARTTRAVRGDLERMEALKPAIEQRRRRWDEARKRVLEVREREKQGHDARRRETDEDEGMVLLDAGEHGELALRLANREELKRRGVRRDDDGTEQRDFDELTRSLRDLGRRLDVGDDDDRGELRHAAAPHYPSAAGRQVRVAPALPEKLAMTAPTPPPKRAATPDLAPSAEYTFASRATTEGGAPLRPLFIPTELRPRFLALAAGNTRSNLETCGILAGTLLSSALFVSHLIVPDQTATSDTCDTTDGGDAALFDYVDGHELMVCGWIHTHPSQTCFLSSRDLHTSLGYQLMLPESVAVVCAPSSVPDHGVFRLTDPRGKQVILACRREGLFHPHDGGELYTDATKPGHVEELNGLRFQVVDLRVAS